MEIVISYREAEILLEPYINWYRNTGLQPQSARFISSQGKLTPKVVSLEELEDFLDSREFGAVVLDSTQSSLRIVYGASFSSRFLRLCFTTAPEISEAIQICSELYKITSNSRCGLIDTLDEDYHYRVVSIHRAGVVPSKIGPSKMPFYAIFNPIVYRPYLSTEELLATPAFQTEDLGDGHVAIQFWEHPHKYEDERSLKYMIDCTRYLKEKVDRHKPKSEPSKTADTVPMLPPLQHLADIGARYETLVRLFGEPGPGDAEKTDVWWDLSLPDGTRAAIHNWKDGKNYLGDEGHPVEEITGWTLKTEDAEASERVKKYVEDGDELV